MGTLHTLHRLAPVSTADDLAELDALHATACDVYDLATSDLDAARRALTEAAWALTEAEEAWSKAGLEMDETARRVSTAREAAGLVLTADGYRQRVTR